MPTGFFEIFGFFPLLSILIFCEVYSRLHSRCRLFGRAAILKEEVLCTAHMVPNSSFQEHVFVYLPKYYLSLYLKCAKILHMDTLSPAFHK